MVPHAECLRQVLTRLGIMKGGPSAEGWSAARACLDDMLKTAPSLLDQVKEVYSEGLRVGMALGRKLENR